MPRVTPEEIDALLPQTQCGLCGYKGCMPYAKAIAFEQAPLNLCPPGGMATLQALGGLLQQDITPHVADMEKKAKPKMRAFIREAECIGCTKCIQACPTDAILGSAKHMHTVIASECTGCELCVAPCPVDCIDIFTLSHQQPFISQDKARQRFNARNARLAKQESEKKSLQQEESLLKKRKYIEEAIARTKARQNQL